MNIALIMDSHFVFTEMSNSLPDTVIAHSRNNVHFLADATMLVIQLTASC